jgi:hypothetical protein
MATGPGPIMVEASKTRRRLRELCFDLGKKIASGDVPEGVDADDAYLSDCLDRFNIWAGSLGVFQKGEASLDSRLSSHVLVKEVIRLLRQLDQFTSDRECANPNGGALCPSLGGGKGSHSDRG